jgi:hypothetical protein
MNVRVGPFIPFPRDRFGLCVRRSHPGHKSHPRFLCTAAIYVIFFFFLGHLVISLIKRWGSVQENETEGVRAEFLMPLLVKLWTAMCQGSFISPHIQYNMFWGAAPATSTENETTSYSYSTRQKYFITPSSQNNETYRDASKLNSPTLFYGPN